MRTVDENLDAYHRLNVLNNIYVKQTHERVDKASTEEELDVILEEAATHFDKQWKLYKELGEEMVEIMDKKCRQFWE